MEWVLPSYPVFENNNRFSVIFINKPKIVQGSSASVMQADSFMNATNNTMAAKAKMIKVTGIKKCKIRLFPCV